MKPTRLSKHLAVTAIGALFALPIAHAQTSSDNRGAGQPSDPYVHEGTSGSVDQSTTGARPIAPHVPRGENVIENVSGDDVRDNRDSTIMRNDVPREGAAGTEMQNRTAPSAATGADALPGTAVAPGTAQTDSGVVQTDQGARDTTATSPGSTRGAGSPGAGTNGAGGGAPAAGGAGAAGTGAGATGAGGAAGGGAGAGGAGAGGGGAGR